ncbi:MAG: hypothetical protein LW707_00840 [Sphingobacteriales bacterium]|jgi:hypothetical protein|nr:hypothetical protein [Sphingobacteriales bacterium]
MQRLLPCSVCLIFLLYIAGCKDDELISPIPEIAFDQFIKYPDAAGRDTAVDFIFTIRDGDGDIGFRENEFDNSCGADNFNLYLAYEEKSGNAYRPKKLWLEVVEVTPACDTLVYFDSVQVKFNQRMQYIEPQGNSRDIEASVRYRMDYASALILLSQAGRFEFRIRDRAEHFSNSAYSDDLLLVR